MEFEEVKAYAKNKSESAAASIPLRLAGKEDKFLSRILKSKVSSLKKLEALYSLMDEIGDSLAKHTPCKKGCSACCHYSVTISDVEILYIEKHERVKRNKVISPKENFHGTPCSFLKNGSCSIYNSRPFVCRRHHTFTKDSYFCSPENSDAGDLPKLTFSNVGDAFDLIRRESQSYDMHDIRQVFTHCT